MPASTAPLSPRPGYHTTSTPRLRAQAATSRSSHTTAVGRVLAAAITCSPMVRASVARSTAGSAGANRTLAWPNAFTGTRTATRPSSSAPGSVTDFEDAHHRLLPQQLDDAHLGFGCLARRHALLHRLAIRPS